MVRDGRAECAIVTGSGIEDLYRHTAEEIKRYVAALSGASPAIVSPAEVARLPQQQALILVGGRAANPMVREAVSEKLASFEGLKKDDFLLRTVQLHGRPAVIVGGNDEASTMYAGYDFLERLGVVFLLSKDIIPERKTDLAVPDLDVRAQTPFTRRGILTPNIYPNRGIMHLSEVKRLLDQMAKLKMNFLLYSAFALEPWIDFEYRGERKLVGDATGKETGFLAWRYNYGSNLTKDVLVGRELFKDRPRMAPAEFQGVETPADAFRVAKNFLNEIIRYAKTRKINVWLCMDPTTLPGNLARYARRAKNLSVPFHPILGTHMCPGDPALHEMNENRLRALAEDYPGAEGYFLFIPEAYPDCPDEEDQELLTRLRPVFREVGERLPSPEQWEVESMKDVDSVVDSVAGSVHIILEMIKSRDRIAPGAKLGIAGLGHSYALPLVDRLVSKDVPFTDMESRGVWTPDGVPMQHFAGMGERERTIMPRIDDDGAMFGMQFNATLYYKDRVLQGSLEYGLAGFVGQTNRVRGTEHNTRYLAEGAWNPHLTPDDFYVGYAGKIFGEATKQDMVAAFKILEENEEYLGWRGQRNFHCCSPIPEVAIAYRLYKQPNPFDGPEGWERFIQQSGAKVEYFTHSLELLRKALRHLEAASPKVAPGAREELNYLRNKTESYALLLETLIESRRGYMAFAEAFRLWKEKSIERAELVGRLDESMAMFTEARKLGRHTTETFALVVDHPSDLGVLYRANLFLVTGLELAEKTMQNIINYHHGREYTMPVPWNKIYWEFPQFSPAR